MKRFSLFVMLAVCMTAMVLHVSEAQTKVRVTFTVNTSTIQDTVNGVTSKVFMSGDFKTPLPSWGDGIQLTNIGGDYWSVTDSMGVGDTVKNGYKFRANGGWEDNFDNSTNNRTLIVGSSDTTLPIAFYNATGKTQTQNWRPWAAVGADSLVVWMRVNMKNPKDSAKFGWTSKDVDSVAVVGTNLSATGDIDPTVSHYLKREGTSDFYSGRIRFKKTSVTDGQAASYNFTLGDNKSGRGEKVTRNFTVPIGMKDTTLTFAFYNNEKPYFPPPVKVTFILNTAGIADTIFAATSKMTVTGDFPALTNWGAGVNLANIGGDYWKATIVMYPTATAKGYKFRANGGWEENFSPQNDRLLQVGTSDTTLPVQYYNTRKDKPVQYWTPWPTTSSDSLNVWVRVNLQSVIENGTFGWKPADKDSVAIMGDNRGATADIDWGTSHYLLREGTSNFWSGRVRFAKSKINLDTVNYKFRFGNLWGRDELGGKPNRSFHFSAAETDTTLAWVWYDNAAPVARVNADTVYVTFQVNMKNATDKKGFSQGDTIVVQSGFFKTGAVDGKEKQLKLLIGSVYSVTDTIITSLTKILNYQYYLVKNNIRVREYYFNFDYKGTNTSEQERRQYVVPSKQFTIKDDTLSVDAPRRQPLFPSQIPLKQAVSVRWILDLRPAYAQVKAGSLLKDGQGTTDILSNNIDSVKKWGVGINGPATNLPTVYPVGDWATWNAASLTADTAKRRMWDDGTHGDAKAGDTLYTVTFNYPAGATAGKISKYGIRGGDNETGFGLNHLDNVDDANATATINVAWGSINPKFYSAWNYNNPLGIVEGVEVPREFSLQQNYPNPFNPSTTIEFALPIQSNVRLTVFNVIGQEVATLVNENMSAGKQSVKFDGTRLSSGVYFYRIVAGQFTSIKKMMLVK